MILFADCECDNFVKDLTRMWTLQIAEGVDGEVIVYADQEGHLPIKEGLKKLKDCTNVVFHNGFGFDYWAINKLYPDTLKPEQIIDSLVMSRMIDSTAKRHSLADIGEALGFHKLHFEDFSKFSKDMVKYGIKDVQILQRMWVGDHSKKVIPFAHFYDQYREACDLEFKTSYVISKQVNHGFRFAYEQGQLLETDLRKKHKDIEWDLQGIFKPIVSERWSHKTGKRLKDGVEVFNPASGQQIEKRLKEKYNWKPKETTPTGVAKTSEDILGALKYPEAKMIAEYQTIGKMLGQLSDGSNAWLKLAEPVRVGNKDTHRIYGQVNTIGARTHRMSHFKPNTAQIHSDPRMRSLWLPDVGYRLVGIDAEGLELRMLAHYLEPYDDGRYIKIVHEGKKEDGTDIHSQNQKAASLFSRNSAKTMIYAHNYGCFDKKLGQIVVDDAKDAGQLKPKGSLTKIGGELRLKLEEGIVGLGELIAKCKRMHHKRKALPSPDGRLIPSLSDHSALNTLLQGGGSIVMKQALVCFEESISNSGLEDRVFYNANVHDEFQLSVHPDHIEEVMDIGKKSIMRAGKVLGIRCPLVGSADVGDSWAETH